MRNRIGNVLWGLVFIIIGIGFLGNILWGWNFELFFDGWWTLFIIVPCGISIIQRGAGVGNLVGISIGILLLLSEIYDNYQFSRLILPTIFIIIGLHIILKNSGYYHKNKDYYEQKKHIKEIDNEQNNHTYYKGDTFKRSNLKGNQATCVLNSKVVDYADQLFEGITLNSVLGAITLDLRNAEIKDHSYIDVATVLGGVDIFVPADVEVRVEQVPILGGVSNKPYTGNYTSVIYLNATCILGGVSIK